jgi:hypothetical protein
LLCITFLISAYLTYLMKNFLLNILDYVIDEERDWVIYLFMSFAPPSGIFVFSLSPSFVLHMYHTGGGRKRHKQTYRQRRIK